MRHLIGNIKRMTAVFLAAAMVLSSVPASTVFAKEAEAVGVEAFADGQADEKELIVEAEETEKENSDNQKESETSDKEEQSEKSDKSDLTSTETEADEKENADNQASDSKADASNEENTDETEKENADESEEEDETDKDDSEADAEGDEENKEEESLDDEETDAEEKDAEELLEEELSEDELLEEELLEEDLTLEDGIGESIYTVSEDGTLALKNPGQTIGGYPETIPVSIEVDDTEIEVKTIPAGIFNKSSVVKVSFEDGSKVTTIGAGAFASASLLEEIELPSTVTSIGANAFSGCSSLKTINIASTGVTEIASQAFMNSGLTAFDATAKVTTIGSSAFQGCTSLARVSLLSAETIGANAFSGCSSLSSVDFLSDEKGAANIRKLEEGAFKGCKMNSVSIAKAESGFVLESSVFEGCTNLTTVRLPACITVIPVSTFQNCKKLSSVLFSNSGSKPSQVEMIETNSFANCSALTEITLPESVRTIQAKAFDGCTAFTTIIIRTAEENAIEFAGDAFPKRVETTKRPVMKGYDGNVQDYAINRGYEFVSLYKDLPINLPTKQEYGKLTISDKNGKECKAARKGAQVFVVVAPTTGYNLEMLTIEVTESTDPIDYKLESVDGAKQKFSFIMPEEEVSVSATYSKKTDAGISSVDDLSFDYEGIIPGKVDKVGTGVQFDRVGRQATVIVCNKEAKTKPWLWNYSSNKAGVATISNTGVITAMGEGVADITATLKSNTKIKKTLQVKVKEGISIYDMTFDLSDAKTKTGKVIDGTIPVVEFKKKKVDIDAITFDFSSMGKDSEGNNLTVTTNWASTDTGIVTVGSAKTTNGKNKLTIKKGAIGETRISATVTNADKTKFVKSFIIRVVDASPRLDEAKLTVNALSSVGTEISLIPVYGHAIEPASLKICNLTNKEYIPTSEFVVTYDALNDVYRIKAGSGLALPANSSRTYSKKTQLYIKGVFADGSDEFEVPIPQLTVTSKPLAPTVKLSGKFNLFYSYDSTDAEQGSVKLTQNLTTEKVERYTLVSDSVKDKENKFASNFAIDATGKITRTGEDASVKAGFVDIKYKGYTTPIRKAITIPTENKTVAYVLSKTAATAHVLSSGQEYELQLLDKKTKAPLHLVEGTELSVDIAGTTPGVFNAPTIDEDDDTIIHLSVQDTPVAGKMVFNVTLPNWGSYQKYTFTLKTTNSKPAVTVAPGTITLNQAFVEEQTGTFTLGLKQDDPNVKLTGLVEDSLVFTGNAKYAEDAKKLIETAEVEKSDGVMTGITFTLPDDPIENTSYAFKATPMVSYGDEPVSLGNTISFKIVVVNKVPELKLKSSTLTLNSLYVGTEEVSTTYTITNAPADGTYAIDQNLIEDGAVAEGITITPKSASVEPFASVIKSLYIKDGVVTAQLKKKMNNFSYGYDIEGLMLEGASDTVAVKKFSITIKGVAKQPSLSLKTTGTLNPIDDDSAVLCTPTFKDIKGNVTRVELQELKPGTNTPYLGDTGNLQISAPDAKGAVKVTAKPDVVLKGGQKYQFNLIYTVDSMNGATLQTSKMIVVTPKQTFPAVTVKASADYLYAGQNRAKTIQAAITPKTAINGTMEKPEWAKGTSDAIKSAFEITAFDSETNTMTLTLVDPSALKLNSSYKLNFTTKYEKQMTNTVGSGFCITVKLKK